MRLEPLVPTHLPAAELSAQEFKSLLGARPWKEHAVRLNLVSDTQGRFWGPNGSSRDLSNEIDRMALINYRSQASVVVTDAATARRERYERSVHAPLLIISRTGDFSGIPAMAGLGRQGQPALSVTADAGSLDLRAMAANNGWSRVLLETGPTTSELLISSGEVDSLVLTVPSAESSPFEGACLPALAALGIEDAVPTWAVLIDGTLLSEWSLSVCGVVKRTQ